MLFAFNLQEFLLFSKASVCAQGLARVTRHKRIQKAFMEKDCTFAPQINKTENDISLTISESANQMQKAAACKAVSNRLYQHAEM